MIFFKFAETIMASPAKRDRLILANLILSILINIFLWLLLAYNFAGAADYLILQYNIYFGISWLGPWYQILILPLIGLVCLIIDFPLSFYFYLKQQIISYLLAFGVTLINIILLVAALLLVYVN